MATSEAQNDRHSDVDCDLSHMFIALHVGGGGGGEGQGKLLPPLHTRCTCPNNL